MRLLLASGLLSCLLIPRLDAQFPPPVTPAGTEQYDVTSSVNGRRYRIDVAPPDGYTSGDTTQYPVLYVLDGHFAFPAAVAARAYLKLAGDLEDVIIVGIGDGEFALDAWLTNRWRDYTPSSDPTADSSRVTRYRVPAGALRSGGGRDFLRVLRQELIPFIESTYRTTGDRGLAGHSLGGLFTTYAMLTVPELFQRYGINSPALWWNGGEMFTAESAFATVATALPKRILFTVGAKEDASMVADMERFARLLGSRGYQGLLMDTVIFQGETHVSVGPAMMTRTLHVLYGAR